MCVAYPVGIGLFLRGGVGICFTFSWVCWIVCLWWVGLCVLLDYCLVHLDVLIVLIFCGSLLKCFDCW